MKNYYQILGLRATASDREVKQVFRRLAVAYHPDKNPAPEAEAIFKEINEAYEILSDPEKRNLYDQLLNGNESTDTVTSEQTEPWHRDPAYRRRKQSGFKHQPAGPSAKQVMMESFLKYLIILSRAGCVFILLLSIDYILPSHISKEKIVTDHEEISKLIARPSSSLLITEKGHHFPIAYSETKYFQPATEVKIFSSPIFALLIKVESETGDYQLNNLATIYRNFVFLPIGLLIFSLAGISSKKEIEFRFNVGIVLILLFLLNIIFFFTSRV